MAHQLVGINRSTGEAPMFYVGDVPWHRLGKRFEEAPTTEVALKAAGLDWQVGMRPLFNELGRQSSHRETFRQDTGSVLGVVGPRYHPLQNDKAFGIFDPLVQDGSICYETAGSLQAGKKVWILAKAAGGDIEIAKGDAIQRYLLLSNSHDGTMAIRMGFTPIRVVCSNTLSAAIGAEDSALIRVRHHAGAVNALENLRDIMDVANATFEATAEQYRRLAQCQVNAADIRRYVKVVFGLTEVDADSTAKVNEMIGQIIPLFEKGRGNDIASIKGSAWALYNATTEYLQYVKKARTDESRLTSLWFGDSAVLNRRALANAVDLMVEKAA